MDCTTALNFDTCWDSRYRLPPYTTMAKPAADNPLSGCKPNLACWHSLTHVNNSQLIFVSLEYVIGAALMRSLGFCCLNTKAHFYKYSNDEGEVKPIVTSNIMKKPQRWQQCQREMQQLDSQLYNCEWSAPTLWFPTVVSSEAGEIPHHAQPHCTFLFVRRW